MVRAGDNVRPVVHPVPTATQCRDCGARIRGRRRTARTDRRSDRGTVGRIEMRWLLDKVRTRLGVAMGLTIVVVGVVAIGKLGGARPEQPIYRADTAAPVPSVDL